MADSRYDGLGHFEAAAAAAVNRTPWTSARCHRLLRPLSSKLTLLRKEQQLEVQQSERVKGAHGAIFPRPSALAAAPSSTARIGQQTRLSRASAADEDGEWESSPRPRKKIRRTYSSKTKIKSSRDGVDKSIESQLGYCPDNAIIELPPQLSFEARSLEGSATDKDCGPIAMSSQRDLNPSSELPKGLGSDKRKLVDGICKGLVTLLRATCCARSPYDRGCRSLLSTCLRQIPQYIAEEESISKLEDPDTEVDISTMVYNDLDQFGAMPGGGWESLRVLVRAHGIKMITDAIEEGVLELPVARHLYHLCLDISANDEAQCIIESLTHLAKQAQHTLPKPAKILPFDLHMIVNSLDSLASSFGRRGFQYRHTAAMLNNDLLTQDWISSKAMIRTWNGVIRSITQGDEDTQSAALLLQTAIAAQCRSTMVTAPQDVNELRSLIRRACYRPALRSTRSDQVSENLSSDQPKSLCKQSKRGTSSTLSTVLTVLSAVARLQVAASSQTSDESNTWVTAVLQDLAIEASQAIELSSQAIHTHHFMESDLYIPLLAAGLAELSSFRSCQNMPSLNLLAEISTNSEIFKGAGSFVCAVARCHGRARSEDTFTVVKALVQDLITVSKATWATMSVRKLCSDLAIATAFNYSEDTSRPAHLDWALQMELNLVGKSAGTPRPAVVRTPARGDRHSKSGFRWEEGICEWIAKTPDLFVQKSIETVNPNADEEKAPPTLSIGVKQTLPLLSASPCALTKKVDKDPCRGENSRMKALHVLIQVGTACLSNNCAVKKLRSPSTRPRKKHWSPRPTQNIHEDGDFDELSVLESSQEKPFALSMLQEPPNAAVGAKRKRHPARHQNSKTLDASNLVSSKLQPNENGQDLEVADVDELALLFKW